MAFKSIIPHNPSEVIGVFEVAGPYDVEIAVVRAREAFFGWREQPAPVRGGAPANIADDVETWAEELARFTVMEVGKPIGEARAEVKQAVTILRYYAQMVLAGVDYHVSFGGFKDSGIGPEVHAEPRCERRLHGGQGHLNFPQLLLACARLVDRN